MEDKLDIVKRILAKVALKYNCDNVGILDFDVFKHYDIIIVEQYELIESSYIILSSKFIRSMALDDFYYKFNTYIENNDKQTLSLIIDGEQKILLGI